MNDDKRFILKFDNFGHCFYDEVMDFKLKLKEVEKLINGSCGKQELFYQRVLKKALMPFVKIKKEKNEKTRWQIGNKDCSNFHEAVVELEKYIERQIDKQS